MKKYVYFLIVIILAGFGFIFRLDKKLVDWRNPEKEQSPLYDEIGDENITGSEVVPTTSEQISGPVKVPEKNEIIKNDNASKNKLIIYNVPFTSQAPNANWADPRQQDSCEEASALMAVKWAKGEQIGTKNDAEKILVAIADYQKDKFGSYQDTSVKDTAERIIKGYFKFDGYKIKNDIKINDLIKDLEAGNIIIVPANGRKLNNPNFKRPGPEYHMLVIKGYDYVKKEFITNDPGTRKGMDYRYPENTLYNAIRDYHSGYHVPVNEIKKDVIIIHPTSKASKPKIIKVSL